MQNAPVNRNLVIVLAVLLVGAVLYFAFAGGLSSVFQSDIPEYAPPPATEPAPATPGPTAVPEGAAAITHAPGGGADLAGPGLGGAPAGGQAGTGGGADLALPGAVGAPPAVAAGALPAEPELSSEEKVEQLEAFRKIDSRDILTRRIEEARDAETEVNAEEGLPYANVGRVDPLFIVGDAIPEELRPPRTGETDYDKILELIIAEYQAAMLESVRIEVWSVMKIGLTTMVNLSIDGRIGTVPVGREIGIGAFSFLVASASQEMVTIILRSGDISRTRSFVPKSY